MADDRRVYSDEEFALILRKAAELASRADSPAASSAGFTLTEMKSAAAQAGLDPALVERAARMLAATATASPLERLTGGPLRHDHEAHFPIKLDENSAALLLSAVRITAGVAGSQDVGHSSSMGMTWHDGGELESLSITARPEEDGTAVSVALDRRGTLALVAVTSGLAMFFAVLFSCLRTLPRGSRARRRGTHRRNRRRPRDRARLLGIVDEEGARANQRRHGRHRTDPQSAGDPGLRARVRSGMALRLPESDASAVADAELTGA